MTSEERAYQLGRDKERESTVKYLQRLADRYIIARSAIFADCMYDLSMAIESGAHASPPEKSSDD